MSISLISCAFLHSMITELSLIDKKIHGVIELTQIMMLELEILKHELQMDSKAENTSQIISIDRIIAHTTNTANLLNEIKKECHSQLSS